MTVDAEDDTSGREAMAESDLLNTICLFRGRAIRMISFGFPLLVLSLMALPFLETGSPSHIVLVIDLVLLLTLLIVSGAIIGLCRRRDRTGNKSFDSDWP